MREGTPLRVMAADRPYGEFYDFYSISLEYFGTTMYRNMTYNEAATFYRQINSTAR
jgi:hypothetical protein